MTHNGVRHEKGTTTPAAAVARQTLASRHADRRQLNNGFGNAMSAAFELAATPALFGALGWWIDGRAGTGHLFFIGFLFFAVVGMFVRTWLRYDAEMKEHEAKAAWAKQSRSPGQVAQ